MAVSRNVGNSFSWGKAGLCISHGKLQILVHMESSQLISKHKGTEACLSSSTMMLASRP